MSIASELNRLLQAKSDLATSITNKGVTVPSSATLDDYPALVDSISGGGTSIYDEMRDYVYVITPYSTAYNATYALSYNLVNGKSYKIILKAKNAPTGNLVLYAYQGNANTPNTTTGIVLSPGQKIAEGTYTHTQTNTFTRLGLYATTSSDRSANFACAIYIKEIG